VKVLSLGAAVDLPHIYEQLEALLVRLGVPVRCEPFDARMFNDVNAHGGLCKVKGSSMVLIDARAPVPDRVAVLAGVLAGFDLEGIYIAPQVRKVIEAHGLQPEEPLAEVIPIRRARTRGEDDV
jgi:hypothetical protein